MKIFSPFAKQEQHPYLLELKRYSKSTILQKGYKEFDKSFDLIHIHWPEAIFNWEEPKDEDLRSLEREIKYWKKCTKIIYTKHDYERTKGNTDRFNSLFRLIEENTDVFIHLGENSRRFYQQKYPKAIHEKIGHHIFEFSFPKIPISDARKHLGIDSDAIVLVAPGNIRKPEERKLVLKVFESMPGEKKVLISTNMKFPHLNFRGRIRLKKFFNIQNYLEKKFKKKYQPPSFLFTYAPLSKKELGIRMSAADIVLVPRIDILNSGIVYLGLSYGKVTLGPAAGNIEEELKNQELPVFNPNSNKSISLAIQRAVEMVRSNSFKPKELEMKSPKLIAETIDQIYFKYAVES